MQYTISDIVMEIYFKQTDIRSTPEVIDYLYDCYDLNKNGLIDYSEFIASCIDTKVKDMDKYLRQIFRQLDLVRLIELRIKMAI